ncbi:MAG: hypothetical protein NTX25_01220 [Proteobacteria bacterium]|nr:hypothetical protein [Pseudomonadota bacterium]
MQFNKILKLPILLASLSLSQFARAEDENPPATLTFQYSGLKWNTVTTKTSPAIGAEVERKTTSLLSSDLADAAVYASMNKFNVYFYPFLDSNALVSLSYMVQSDLELGFDLGVSHIKVNGSSNELSDSLFGIFAIWSKPISTMTLENSLTLDATSSKSVSFNEITQQESKTQISGKLIKAMSIVLVPLSRNASYFGGLWLGVENKKDSTDGEKTAKTQFGITLAGLRISLE